MRAGARALVALLALCASVASADPRATHNTDPTPPSVSTGQVVMLGSSSVNGAFGRLIEGELERRHIDVLRHGRSATGLSRPDFFDWEAHIRRAGSLATARGAIILLGGNDAQSMFLRQDERRLSTGRRPDWVEWGDERGWRNAYRLRTKGLVDALCAAGVPKVLVVIPADGTREGWINRIPRVQEEQLEGARLSRCGRGLDTRGARPRESDTLDGIHLSSSGARAVWARVGNELLRYFDAVP
jgi:hypothetical protein